MKDSFLPSSEYVSPNIGINQSPKLSDFIKSLSTEDTYHFQDPVKHLDLIEKDRVFIIGEPGYGKSRLLKQLYKEFEARTHKCVFIDLKKVTDDIGTYIEERLKDSVKTINKGSSFYSSKKFTSLNQDHSVLLIDGLDEVHSDIIPYRLDEINSLTKAYPNLKIFLTCRTHHISRYSNELFHLDFECVELRSFSVYQAIEFLRKNCSNLPELDDIALLDKLQETQIYSFSPYLTNTKNTLTTPRYLELLASIINDKGLENAISLNRSELFDLFIINRLKKESKVREGDKQSYSSKIPYIKQFLERLALVMEIQRVNEISKDDFTTFLLDTQMNLDNQILLEVFYDRTILKDNGDTLEFDNTEFQEYLAAKALVRLGKTEQLIFDVAVEQQLKSVYSSWVDVLSFLVQLKPTILSSIVNFAFWTKAPDLFELIKYVKPQNIQNGEEDKEEIFHRILNYYQKNKIIIPHNFEILLSRYYVEYEHKKVFKNSNSIKNKLEQFVIRANEVLILKEVFRNKILSDTRINQLKQILFTYLDSVIEIGDTLHRFCLEALSLVCEIEEFEPYLDLYDISRKGLCSTLVRVHISIDPNHPNTIDLMLKDAQREKYFSNYDFEKIDSVKGFKYFFKKLLKNVKSKSNRKSLLHYLNDHGDLISNTKKGFIFNLKEKWNLQIEKLVVQILIESCRDHMNFNSGFHFSLSSVLKEKSENPALSVIKGLKKKDINDQNDYWIAEFISTLIDPEQFQKAYQLLIELKLKKVFIRWMIQFSPDKNVNQLEKKYFPKEYQETIARSKKIAKEDRIRQEKRDNKILSRYNKFVTCLNKGHEHTIIDYQKDQKALENKLTPLQKRKLKKIIENFLINYDPHEGTLTKNENGHSVTSYIQFYKASLSLAGSFKIDLTPYRSKILALIPYTWELETILEYIPSPTDSEINNFINWFLNKKDDDLQLHGIGNFISICEKFKYYNATELLVSIIKNEAIENYLRINAMSLIFSWKQKPVEFYKILFEAYSTSLKWSANYKLAIKINELLIESKDEEAVSWRIKEVLDSKYKIDKNFSGMRGVSKEEGLGIGLRHATDLKFYNEVLFFLGKSFECVKKDENYSAFARDEVWEFAIHYFKNLKRYKSKLSTFLNDLTELANKHEIDSFNYGIRHIKTEYLSFLGEPEKFTRCIQQFNQLKSRQYLPLVYPIELFTLISEVIKNELRQWVQQGFYGFINDLKTTSNSKVQKERIIQKTIVTQLENFLLKRGLRNSDITEPHPKFYREVEKLDGDKVDLIISYGAVGAVMVEIKRANNPDLAPSKLEKYKNKKFLPYMNETNCEFGIFLIFRDNERNPVNFNAKLKKVKKAYEDFQNIVVIGLDCVKN